MRTHLNTRISLAFACLATFSLISIRAGGTPAAGDVAILVNTGNPVDNLTLPELRKIYMGERQYWKASSPVLLLMRSAGAPEREVILRVVLQMTEEQYTQYWVAKVMRAEAAAPPTSLFSFGFMQEGIRGNRGAIGYVNASEVGPGVKVLRIGGLRPGEPGYPLH